MALSEVLKQKETQDYYSILEVKPDATANEIRKARRKLIAKYHPDKHEQGDKKISERISAIINNAFEALSDIGFREKYDKSGMSLEYSVSDTDYVRKPLRQEKSDKDKGITLTAVVTISPEFLEKGGKIEANPIPVPGEDIDLSPITIEIKPNAKIDSFLLFKGLGQKVPNGSNGDLLVMLRTSKRLNFAQEVKYDICEKTPLINLEGFKGEETDFNLGGLLDNEIKLKKTGEEKTILFIREVSELNRPLLLKY